MEDVQAPEDIKGNYSFRTPRRIGDNFTWKIALNTLGVLLSSLPSFVFEKHWFALRYDTDDLEEIRSYTLHSYIARRSLVLKYQYLNSEPSETDVDEGFFKMYAPERLDRAALVELSKLEKWPIQGKTAKQLVEDGCVPDFKVPAYWQYRDHEMPRWATLWEAQNEEEWNVENLEDACFV